MCKHRTAIRAAFGELERRAGQMQCRPGAEYVGYVRADDAEDDKGWLYLFGSPEDVLEDYFEDKGSEVPAEGDSPVLVRVRIVMEQVVDPATTRRAVLAGVIAEAESRLHRIERERATPGVSASRQQDNREMATACRRRLREAEIASRAGG